jgi:MOSC domain-containing protein YiiM
MTSVVSIFVAEKRGAPMRTVASVECVADCGLVGDRYYDIALKGSGDQGVTLIESEHIEAFCQETGIELGADMPRRNIVTRGVRLNDLVGQEFLVGDSLLQGVELAEPCRLFQRRTHREVLKFFANKGGLRARVLKTGLIAVGDGVSHVSR